MGQSQSQSQVKVSSQTSRCLQASKDVKAYLEANPSTNKEQLICDFIEKCGDGALDSIKKLLECGADKNGKDEGGSWIIIVAVENGATEIVRALLSRLANPNVVSQREGAEGASPLHIAPATVQNTQDSLVIVKALLDFGAELNMKTVAGATPLLIASQFGNVTVTEELIKRGAGVDLADNEGRSPLHVAVQNGHRSTVKCLVEAGVDINSKTNKGCTPLGVAFIKRHLDIAAFLIKNGANEVMSTRP